MSLLLTLVASLILIWVAHRGASISDGCTRSGKTIPIPSSQGQLGIWNGLAQKPGNYVPRHMVGSTAAVTLHRRKGGGVQSTSRRRQAGGEGATMAIRAGARKVSEATAILDRGEEDKFRICGEPDEATLDSRSTSDRCSGAEGSGTRPGYGPHLRTSSIAWRQPSEVADKPPTHGPAGGSCSKAAAQRNSSLQCAPLQKNGYDVGYRRITRRPAIHIRFPHLKHPFLLN